MIMVTGLLLKVQRIQRRELKKVSAGEILHISSEEICRSLRFHFPNVRLNFQIQFMYMMGQRKNHL